MPISPTGTQRVQAQAKQPDQPDPEWLIPLIMGAVTTAALAYAFTPAATPAMAKLGIAATPGIAGTAGASVGGGIAHQSTAKAMQPDAVQQRVSRQLQGLASAPLSGPKQQASAGPAPSGGGGQKKPAPNPFTMAFRSGFGRVG